MVRNLFRVLACIGIVLGPGCGATISSLIAGPFLDEGRRLMEEVRKENGNLAKEWRGTNEAMLENMVAEAQRTREMSMAAWAEARAGLNSGQDGFRDGIAYGGLGTGGVTGATAAAMARRNRKKNGENSGGGATTG